MIHMSALVSMICFVHECAVLIWRALALRGEPLRAVPRQAGGQRRALPVAGHALMNAGGYALDWIAVCIDEISVATGPVVSFTHACSDIPNASMTLPMRERKT